MRILGHALAISGCLWILGCGSSEPQSPLILGGRAKDAIPGLRTLTASQTRRLQGVITAAGEPCAELERAYLRDVDPELGSESWDVRCADGAYSVRLAADGTRTTVRPCIARSRREEPCYQSYPTRRAAPPLNPELGDLLAPMTSKSEKND